MTELWEIIKTYKEGSLIKKVEWLLHTADEQRTVTGAGVTLLKTAMPLESTLDEIVVELQLSIPASYVDSIRSHNISLLHELADKEVLDGISTVHYSDPKLVEQEVRQKRRSLLAETDWLVAFQVETKVEQPAVTAYRQKLRDVPLQAGFPHDIVWPVKP